MPIPTILARAPRRRRVPAFQQFVGIAVFAAFHFTLLPATASGHLLSLDEAVAVATERAPVLLARDASRRAASEDLVRADALPDPTLTFGVQNFPIAGPDAFSVTDDRMTMRRVGVVQALPSRAKRMARRDTAEARLAEADAMQVATVLEVRRAAAQAWVALWAAEQEHALLLELKEETELAVRATRARLAGGQGSASAALAARGTDLELENRLDQATARIEQARAALARWLGELPSAHTAPPPDFSLLPVNEAELLANVDRLGPLLAWNAREAAAEAALAQARAEKRPDWSIGAGFAQRGAGASDVVWLEVGVGLPMFPRNRQDRGIRARAADRDAVLANREDARRMQTEIVRRAVAEWVAPGRQVRRYRAQLLPLARDRTQVALAAYSGGASLQDWLDARGDEIDARIDYADALAAWGQAWASLAYLLPGETRP